MLSETLIDMDFTSSPADPDVWLRPTTRPDGTELYDYLLVYTDDILAVSWQAKEIIEEIGKRYEIKDLGKPETYLGAVIAKQQLSDGSEAWSKSANKYVQNALDTVQTLFNEDGRGQKIHKRRTPLPAGYKPELEMTEELSDDMMSGCRQLIGILRWAVELGRIDILYEVGLMSQYQAVAREGHLEALYHIFGYLSTKKKVKLVFDPNDVEVDEAAFNRNADWHAFYGDVAEELPPRMPTPRGKFVSIHCFVDANHAGNVVTRRSHTGVLLFVQNSLIAWHSKKQSTIETSTFGSEFVAMRQAKEMIVALRYKLRMFGVGIRGPANVYCDNAGVVKNTSIPESTLTKKHLSIAYHSVREAAAAGIIRVAKEDGETNLADLLTKLLSKPRRDKLLSNIVWGPFYDADEHPEWVNSKRKREEFEDDE